MSTINENFEFSKDWTDAGDFPTKEYSEKVVRENIQLLFDELKAYINTNLITAINDNMSRISNLGGGDDVQHDALADDAVWANNIKDGEITEDKYKDGSITPEKFNATEVDPYIKDLADGRINTLAVLGVKGSAESSYRKGNVELTKANLGLGNVDNTSDASKPISTATQTALNGKQATVTGAASSVVTNNLTASRALASDSSGKIVASSVTVAELGRLSGVSGDVQTQLNAKAPLASPALTGTPTAPTATNATNSTQIATTAFVHNYATKLEMLGARALSVTRGSSGTISFTSGVLGYTPTYLNTLVHVVGTSAGAEYCYWGASYDTNGTVRVYISNENPSGSTDPTDTGTDTYMVCIFKMSGVI